MAHVLSTISGISYNHKDMDEIVHCLADLSFATVVTDDQLTLDQKLAAMSLEIQGWIAKQVFEWISEVDGLARIKAGNATLVGCRWVFTVPDGTVDIHSATIKGRCVVKGFQDTRDLMSASPTVDKSTFKLFLYASQALHGSITLADVSKAYLNAEDTFSDSHPLLMRPQLESGHNPPGFWRLLKAVYGRKDAGLLWNRCLHSAMMEQGWHRSRLDPCMYYKKSQSTKSCTPTLSHVSVVHVDDLAVAGSQSELETAKLGFEMGKVTPLSGKPHSFTGLQVIQTPKGVLISMELYIINKLCHPVTFVRRNPSSPLPVQGTLPTPKLDRSTVR